jgi:two-component system, OmpR family, KDP operon response regulator KdpE
MTRLLIVEDEPQIVRVLRPALTAEGYALEAVATGAQALTAAAAASFHAIILDLGLPDMDGKDVIMQIRSWSKTPIVVLSARDAEDEKIQALDLGADDFVNKPFRIGELLARIRAALRHAAHSGPQGTRLTIDHLDADFETKRIFVQNKLVRLSPREMTLLKVFAEHRGMVLTHKQIIAAVWGGNADVEAQFVRVLVGNLRMKIERVPSEPALILTEAGLGYRLADDASSTRGNNS